MVKKTDKEMTDQELGMMYLKAAHSVRIYIYKWVLTDPSPNNFHLKNLWRVGQVAVHRGQTRASVLSTRLRNYKYPRNTDLPSQIAKTDAKGFGIFNDTLEVIEVIEEPSLPVVTARMTPIKKLPRVLAHARADEAERRIIAELGVWRGFGAPEPWRQRLNVSAGGQGDEWERIRSEVLREVRRKTKGKGGCACGGYCSRRFCPTCCHKQPYACDHDGCGKIFAQASHFEVHKRSHTGEKPYACDHDGCGKIFAQASHFEVHKRSHTGEKPFACDYVGCTYACTTSSALTVHKRSHTGEKPFACDYVGCTYASTQSCNLQVHIKRSHTGEKPFA